MEALMNIDRRWLFLIVFVIVFGILIHPIGLPIVVGPDVQKAYDYVQGLPAGSVVWLGIEFSQSSKGELLPMVLAVANQLFKNNDKIVVSGMWQYGTELVQPYLESIAQKYGKQYGVDWINLGWRPGNATFLHQATQDLNAACAGVDHSGQPLSSFPIMQSVKALTPDYFKLAIVFDAGTPGLPDAYIPIVYEPLHLPLLDGTIQMSVQENKNYLQAGQIVAMIPGSAGAAQYEKLVGAPGQALASQDPLSLGALFVTLLVILGNIGYFATRGKKA